MPEKENQEELNIKQLRFIDGIIEGKPQKTAYKDAGYEGDDDSLQSNSSRLIRNDKVKQELTERLNDIKFRNRLRLGRISEVAIAKVVIMLQNDDVDDKVKLDAIKDVLDRAGLKPTEEHNVNLKGELNVTDARAKLISKLDSLTSKRETESTA